MASYRSVKANAASTASTQDESDRQGARLGTGIPTLVDLAARGAVEGKTLTGFGWILSHGNSKAQLQEINKAFRAYLNDHMGRYSATEQSRIRRAFGLNLEGRGGVAQ
jgi:glutamate synthase domain-containing protein 1